MDNKKMYLLIAIFVIIFTFFGGSLAYWEWETTSNQRTNVVFTANRDFMCEADGGGNINNGQISLVPTSCTNSNYAIKRTVTVKPTVYNEDLSVSMDLWLDIKNIGSGLSNSQNFRYALTTSSTSCTEGVVSEGNFHGKTSANGNNTIEIFRKTYSETSNEQYYLYIWLDSAETSPSTMDQPFSISLNGSCTSDPNVSPEKPELDDGLIPITLSEDGVATTVAPSDSSWYDYDNKEWANAVLVNKDATSGVTGSKSREYYKNNPGTTVIEDDILAYYVWIPRYKYRIKETVLCSELENPTEEMYPECYDGGDYLSESDKELLINWWYEYSLDNPLEDSEFTFEVAAAQIEMLLNTGSLYVEWEGREFSLYEIVCLYNDETGGNMQLVHMDDSFNGDNVVIKNERLIDIVFETKISPKTIGDAVDTFMTHPTFIWDGKPIAGFWVGKFETSTNTSSTCYTSSSDSNCNNTNQEPRILPNVKSLRLQNISNQFQTSLKFAGGTLTDGNVIFAGSDTYGLTKNSDSHMMKNSEWGAVAYLSHSKYGINQEIYINNSFGNYTGRSGGNISGNVLSEQEQYPNYNYASANSYSTHGYYTWNGKEIVYNEDTGTYEIGNFSNDISLGTKASTTGNITGIYDMSGGTSEYVMGNYGNTIGSSGFSTLPSSKYYDLYSSEQFTGSSSTNINLCTLETCGGHAIKETANWYEDSAIFVNSENPWVMRGGFMVDGVGAGAFNVNNRNGDSGSFYSWRSVLVLGDGAR